jgi:hypothetical protein
MGSALITCIVLVGFSFWQNQQERASDQNQFEEIQDQLNEIKAPLEKIAFPSYYTATKEMKTYMVVENQLSNAITPETISGMITKKIKLDGQIEDGYLLAEASVDNGKKLKGVDSIYVNLVDYAGHLFRIKSLSVPASESSTLILFNLKDVPYLKNIPYDETKTPNTNNWINLLNENNEYLIHSFLSSARSGGKIIRVVIAYSCKVETPNCSIVGL